MIQWIDTELAQCQRVDIQQAATITFTSMDEGYRERDDLTILEDQQFEMVVNPRGRFYYDPPPFVGLTGGPLLLPPIFFIFKDLDVPREEIKEQSEALDKFLRENSNSDEGYPHVE